MVNVNIFQTKLVIWNIIKGNRAAAAADKKLLGHIKRLQKHAALMLLKKVEAIGWTKKNFGGRILDEE